MGGLEALTFRTGAAICSRLGDEQLRDEITAVVELVKNGYDADATWVRLELTEGNQKLVISDNGSGMNYDDLRDKWFRLATENKLKAERSPLRKRRRLGHKGIGRFAAHKLGHALVLRTRNRDLERAKSLQVLFDWDVLDQRGDEDLGDFKFPARHVRQKPFDPNPTGTVLEIRDLRVAWTRKRMGKLRKQLCSLIDPEAGVSDFSIQLSTPWDELNGPLTNPLAGNETHVLSFNIREEGTEVVRLTTPDNPKGDLVEREAADQRASFGSLRGKLCYFAEGVRRSETVRGGGPPEDWNMGIRIFRDGFRIRPYGEPGQQGDWVQIYQRRYIGGSRFRLKPHYLQGSIHISRDCNPNLRDTSSREGLEENGAFESLAGYIRDLITRLNDAVRAGELKAERQQKNERYKEALEPLTKALNQVESPHYKDEVSREDRERQREVEEAARRTQSIPGTVSNAHWECFDCGDSWKVPMEETPQRCRDLSVDRAGRRTYKPGCGSTNIGRKVNEPRGAHAGWTEGIIIDDETEFLRGSPAYVSGVQLRPEIDWNMGPRDEEAEVRSAERTLAINGNHLSFVAADSLDGRKVRKDDSVAEVLQEAAALKTHIINAAAFAWGYWHYELNEDFKDYLSRTRELKEACIKALPAALPAEAAAGVSA